MAEEFAALCSTGFRVDQSCHDVFGGTIQIPLLYFLKVFCFPMVIGKLCGAGGPSGGIVGFSTQEQVLLRFILPLIWAYMSSQQALSVLNLSKGLLVMF